MDTSETYIKMCDCPEIQVLAKREAYGSTDFFYGELWEERYVDGKMVERPDGHPRVFVVGEAEECGHCLWPYSKAIETAVWLPRQDQLQEMVDGEGDRVSRLADKVYWWVECVTDIGLFEPQSMEQLWLALVMHEKHNKHWNGSEWVQ